MNKRIYTLLLFAVIVTIVYSGFCNAVAAEPSRVSFVVRCFDVGKAALEGRRGVIAVENSWQGLSEINRVSYDASMVDVHQLEAWLREAGTYIRTVSTEPDR